MDSSTFPGYRYIHPVLAEMAEVAGYLWLKGWAERNSGNISVRVTDFLPPDFRYPSPVNISQVPENFRGLTGDFFLITAAGCRMRDVHKDPENHILLIHIVEDGTAYETYVPLTGNTADLQPTSELISHLMIHRYLKGNKPTRNAIVHTHPSALIALTHSKVYREQKQLNRVLWGLLPEAVILVPDGVGVVSYQHPGTRELAVASIKILKDHDILLWEKHGCLAVASSAMEAFDLIDVVVKSADILFKCLHAGYVPEGLSDG